VIVRYRSIFKPVIAEYNGSSIFEHLGSLRVTSEVEEVTGVLENF
jgi:hypothetical protein